MSTHARREINVIAVSALTAFVTMALLFLIVLMFKGISFYRICAILSISITLAGSMSFYIDTRKHGGLLSCMSYLLLFIALCAIIAESYLLFYCI